MTELDGLINTINQLDLSELEWSTDPNLHNQDIPRLELKDSIQTYFSNPSNLSCICEFDKAVKSSTYAILKRIGTESNDGEIYLVQLNVHDILMYAVIKIIPYKNESTPAVFQNEITIGRICSRMVEEGESIHFPILYKVFDCDDLIFPHDSLLYKISFRHSIVESAFHELTLLLNNHHVPDSIHTEAQALKLTIGHTVQTLSATLDMRKTILSTINTFLRTHGIPESIELQVKIRGFSIVNELATMDLSQYVFKVKGERKQITDAQWLYILSHIVQGIRDLQTKNILHHDLHLGNILMLTKTTGDTWLIHDFGKSEIRHELTSSDRKEDILMFLDIVNSTSCKSEKMGMFIQAFIANIVAMEVVSFDQVVQLLNEMKADLFKGGRKPRAKTRRKRKRCTVYRSRHVR